VSSALLVLLVAVNPIAVAAEQRGRIDRRVLAAGLAATALLAVALAATSEAILDVLSVTAPTFRVAAGAVLLLAAARWVVLGPRRLPPEDELLADDRADAADGVGDRADGDGADPGDPGDPDAADRPVPGRWSGLVVPLLVPVLVSPQLVMVAIAVGADEGVVAVAVGAAVALGLAGGATLLRRGRPGLWALGVRFTGLPAAAVAAGMIVDGVKAV
jgi:small neutral amino acid transporter SnatA (MarC family)